MDPFGGGGGTKKKRPGQEDVVLDGEVEGALVGQRSCLE